MLKNYITPSESINDLFILDVGEETQASINPRGAAQRFRCIIHFVVEGSGILKRTTANTATESELTKNTAFGIFEADTSFYKSNPENPMHYFWVGFSGAESARIMNYIGFMENSPTVFCDNGEEITAAFRQLIHSWKNFNRYSLFSAFYNLVCVLKKNNKTQYALSFLKSDNEFFEKAEHYIKLNIHNNIKVQDVADALNIDRSYFTKIFKKRFRTSPHEYITRLRLREAEILLTSSNYTISQISELLNFSDVFSFSKCFKRQYNCSPLQLRKDFINAQEKKIEAKSRKTTNSKKQKKEDP